MSGRAGRRGKDDSGTVIFMLADSMTPEEAKELLQGQPDPLNSAFHLTYNMLLNLLRVEDINPEYLMERSFCQFQNYATLPLLQQQLEQKREQLLAMASLDLDRMEPFYQIKRCIDELEQSKWKYMHKPQYIVPFLQTGRLVRVCLLARGHSSRSLFIACAVGAFSVNTLCESTNLSISLSLLTD
ncbi:Exosome RNA helicase MTR4 [Cichlidogyrus casuarinus]|uniref:Exosome RNA helicase MTR4 n=1 Tax=Cichlidogyrus casuarinus TaxID=1844966 RepID=A0ABD2PR03_9PLAT